MCQRCVRRRWRSGILVVAGREAVLQLGLGLRLGQLGHELPCHEEADKVKERVARGEG